MRPERRKSRSHLLADQIVKRIEEEQLPDGEVFMTEEEVALEYEVSRTVAREAVGRLRAIGLLEGRQRKGLIVRRPDPVRLFSASLATLSRSASDRAEIAQLRYALEVGAIELAVRNATPEQITQLEELAVQLSDALNQRTGITRQKELDITFHTLLLEMTGSTLIARMQRVLVDFFESLAADAPDDEASTQRIGWEHTELASAIRDRDVERARTIIRMQVRRYLPGSFTNPSPPVHSGSPETSDVEAPQISELWRVPLQVRS
ncbi:MAG: FadR/GntR family transcriptional regulator [Pirellulaceae bacterium]